jgi:hypothetical protein
MSGFSLQQVGQYIVSSDPVIDKSQLSGRVGLFNEDGTPFSGGGSASAVNTTKVTVSSDYILTTPPRNPASTLALIPDDPAYFHLVLGAFGRLKFKSRPYEGDLYTGMYVIISDPLTGWGAFIAGPDLGFWDTTEDISFQLFPNPNFAASGVPRVSRVSFLLQGDGLTNGDSDLDIVLHYLKFPRP